MSGGKRPIGTAKGKQPDTKAFVPNPPSQDHGGSSSTREQGDHCPTLTNQNAFLHRLGTGTGCSVLSNKGCAFGSPKYQVPSLGLAFKALPRGHQK